ncbi:MAG: hypothetical protein IJC90_00810 [Clostridia bacterium]|nr:hypothetical protein [Clostridia bacterium]
MRNLIISREKSFTACLVKYKVYARSTDGKGMKFRKERYKKLGTIKNGEQVTFQIPEEETKILVTPGFMSKDICNDIVSVPMGVEDVSFSGKAKYNPFLYNPFQFNDPVGEETIKNRKQNNKNLFLLIAWYIFCIVIGIIIGFSLAMAESEPKTFSVDEMQITLTEDFSEIKFDDYDAGFTNYDYLSITVVKDDIKLTEEYKNLTLEEFGNNAANYVQENYFGEYGGYCSDFKSEDGLNYIEYQINYEDGTANYYKEYFYEVPDGFWRVCFGCATEQKYIAYYNSFDEWASSVTFTEAV